MHLREAFKRAAVFVISQPLFMAGVLVVATLLLVICWYVPIMIGYAFTYLALIANVAVVTVLEQRSRIERSSQKSGRAPR
jgi:hypothetical protein